MSSRSRRVWQRWMFLPLHPCFSERHNLTNAGPFQPVRIIPRYNSFELFSKSHTKYKYIVYIASHHCSQMASSIDWMGAPAYVLLLSRIELSPPFPLLFSFQSSIGISVRSNQVYSLEQDEYSCLFSPCFSERHDLTKRVFLKPSLLFQNRTLSFTRSIAASSAALVSTSLPPISDRIVD